MEDRVLLATFTVTSTFDNPTTVTAGDGTLRGEILASNATTTANVIDFTLPAGLQTITLKSGLPIISTPLLIDGTTATGYIQAPLIQISGVGVGGNVAGPAITVDAAGSEIRALIVNNFVGNAIQLNGGNSIVDGSWIGIDSTGTKVASNTGDGILVDSPGNIIGGSFASPNVIAGNGNNDVEITGTTAVANTVTNNFIGTNAAGTAALNTSPAGYGLAVSSANNTIGGATLGTSLGQGNLIAGAQEGLILYAGANRNVVQGNFIGTDVTGKLPLGNIDFGLYINGGQGNTIGGTVAGLGNVISGNGNDGVRIQGATSTANQLYGNLIGVGSDGATAVGNGHWGVQLNGASNNAVGSTVIQGVNPAYGNVIEDNGTVGTAGGVLVVQATGDGILSNDIYQNNGPGISLNGANAGVKAPTITSVQSGAGQTRVIGTFAGNPNTQYRIQFFDNQMSNPSGIGDGQFYLPDDLDIITNGQGLASISTTLLPNIPVGDFLTATATQGVIVSNNTSAFSAAVEAVQAARDRPLRLHRGPDRRPAPRPALHLHDHGRQRRAQ